MKKVIVFGGSGFIGSFVAKELAEKGYKVTIFDVNKPEFEIKNTEFVKGDFLDKKLVEENIKDNEIVYNFAGIVDLDVANDKPYETLKTNYIGNLNILDACVKNGTERYIFASSIYVYSNKGAFYKCSKQICELMIETYQQQFGLPFTILRYGSVYGPYSQENNWVKQILEQAIKTKKIIRKGDGEELREYIHVEDAAKASVDILKDEFKNQNVILTGNEPIRVKDMLLMIKEMFNNEIEIEYDTTKKWDDHYEITPYTFKPKLGKKYLVNPHIDLGQGILDLLYEIGGFSN
jgi:UDP-glucose 4-epimerase